MNFDTVGIPISFVILGIMALWLIIGSKGWWWLKGAFIVLSLYFSFALVYSTDNLIGWPSSGELPLEFRIYWAEVKEPIKSPSREGAVYLWVREIKIEEKDGEESYNESFYDSFFIDLYPKIKNESRLYRLPYSSQSRDQIEKLKKEIAKGKKFYGKRNGSGFDGEVGEGEGKGRGTGPNGQGKGKGKGLYHYEIPGDIKFYELPPPKMPRKD